jgi:multiple sugar transport system ATP-binding protein
MADKIVVMHDGIVEQMGAPLELYDRPDNQFVAGFIGSPAMNFIPGHIRSNGGAAHVEAAGGIKLPLVSAPAASDGRPVTYGVRPEYFTLADDGADAEVVVVEPTGSETQLVAKLAGHEIVALFRERQDLRPGQKIKLRPRADAIHLFDGPSGKRL